MTDRFVTHDTMQLERTYPAAPGRVFSAWADRNAKLKWFFDTDSDVAPGEYELEFRIGGRELSRASGPEGAKYTYEARYDDIVDGERIVYSSVMLRDDTRISASLTCVEFRPSGEGTQLVLVEHGIYLDGQDKPEFRAAGVGHQLDALGRRLA